MTFEDDAGRRGTSPRVRRSEVAAADDEASFACGRFAVRVLSSDCLLAMGPKDDLTSGPF
jgi:hypothetical protein